MARVDSIVGLLLLLMLLLILVVLFFIFCKPWRFFFSSRSRTIKVGELERPLVSDGVDQSPNQSNELSRDYDLEGACYQNEGHFRSPRTRGLVHKSRVASTAPNLAQGDSLVLDVISDHSEDVFVGQTLKRPLLKHQLVEEKKHVRESLDHELCHEFVSKEVLDQRSCLILEVISGPSCGLCCSVLSTNSSKLPLTLGRVSPSDLLLKDSEVSGKHALINWNLNNLRWEVTDMGSLNGTLLNSRPINHSDSGSRHWGDPVEIATGDIITLGTTSKIYVHITSQSKCEIPFGVGVASDPMALRHGGKKLPMEDVCYYQWPLPGIDQKLTMQFGLFGVCDGHGGAGAAKSASKLLPEMVATILSDSRERERVLSMCDASDVLRDAFFRTEASLNHHYEGCTATVLLVWADGNENFFAQCANVGDSSCVINVDGKQIKMTEDHRVTSYTERLRMEGRGEPLKDGETRLFGLNLARMLGDKFLKQQDARFSSEPYISQVVHIDQASRAFALLASDGFWDVISVKKAFQLVLQFREQYSSDKENSAAKIANSLLSEARTMRTKDNTSVIFLDFDTSTRTSFDRFRLDNVGREGETNPLVGEGFEPIFDISWESMFSVSEGGKIKETTSLETTSYRKLQNGEIKCNKINDVN
ncbi:Kinase associated protein phosphatase [Trema orientale]|uniref:protein-serine/threonine phosphatase n=1 Tax=Trema orientale TaxID=63057 RepID=A0A2P5FWS4_TREOI|nr:Kinase associated protein phosphatase [Trema orientale]